MFSPLLSLLLHRKDRDGEAGLGTAYRKKRGGDGKETQDKALAGVCFKINIMLLGYPVCSALSTYSETLPEPHGTV